MIRTLVALALALPPAAPGVDPAEFLARPRPPLSDATARAARELAALLEGAGLRVELHREEFELELASRASLVLRDERGAELHRRVLARDASQVPAADWLPVGTGPGAAAGRASGAVLDVLDGGDQALAALDEARLELAGTVALCDADPAGPGEQVERLAARGCLAVLLAPPPGELRARAWWIDPGPGAGPPVPVLALHAAEAAFLRESLVVRRLTGPDGRRSPRPTGPGPVVAEVQVESGRAAALATSLTARRPGPAPTTELLTAALDGPPEPLLALVELSRRGLAPGQALAVFDGGRLAGLGARGWAAAHPDRVASLERVLELVAEPARASRPAAGAFPATPGQVVPVPAGAPLELPPRGGQDG